MNKQISTTIVFLFAFAFFSSGAIADTYDNGMPLSLSCEEAYRSIQWHDSPIKVTYDNNLSEENFGLWGGSSKTTLTFDIYGRKISSSTDGENGTSIEGKWEYPTNSDGCSTSGFHIKDSWRLLNKTSGEVLGVQITEYDYPEGTISDFSEEGVPVMVPYISQKPEPTRECDRTQVPAVRRNASELTDVQDDFQGRAQSRITYDIYDRPILIKGTLPLGFTTEDSYEYFENNYLMPEYSEPGACTYRERRSRESGRMLRDGSVVASYTTKFNEDGSIIENTSEGGTFVRWALSVLAPLLGYQNVDPESEEWLDQRFGEQS